VTHVPQFQNGHLPGTLRSPVQITYVSILSDAGVDIDQIADAAGHINASVTRTVYRHVIADRLATAARVMDERFRASGGAS